MFKPYLNILPFVVRNFSSFREVGTQSPTYSSIDNLINNYLTTPLLPLDVVKNLEEPNPLTTLFSDIKSLKEEDLREFYERAALIRFRKSAVEFFKSYQPNYLNLINDKFYFNPEQEELSIMCSAEEILNERPFKKTMIDFFRISNYYDPAVIVQNRLSWIKSIPHFNTKCNAAPKRYYKESDTLDAKAVALLNLKIMDSYFTDGHCVDEHFIDWYCVSDYVTMVRVSHKILCAQVILQIEQLQKIPEKGLSLFSLLRQLDCSRSLDLNIFRYIVYREAFQLIKNQYRFDSDEVIEPSLVPSLRAAVELNFTGLMFGKLLFSQNASSIFLNSGNVTFRMLLEPLLPIEFIFANIEAVREKYGICESEWGWHTALQTPNRAAELYYIAESLTSNLLFEPDMPINLQSPLHRSNVMPIFVRSKFIGPVSDRYEDVEEWEHQRDKAFKILRLEAQEWHDKLLQHVNHMPTEDVSLEKYKGVLNN